MAHTATTANKPRNANGRASTRSAGGQARQPKAKARPKPNGGQAGISDLERDALALHAGPRPGKLSIAPLKPITTQRDLSLA